MIKAALSGILDNVGYRVHPLFGAAIPMVCPKVPSEICSPRETWQDDNAFYQKANDLALKFQANFDQYREHANHQTLAGEPKPNEKYAPA